MNLDDTDTPDNTDRSIADRFTRYYGENLGKAFGVRAITFALFIAIAYVLRPLIHSPLYAMRYSPSGLIVGTISLLTLVALWFSPRFQDVPIHDEWIPRDERPPNEEPFGLGTLKSVGGKVLIFTGIWLVAVVVYSFLAGLIAWVLAATFIIAALAAPFVAYSARGDTGINISISRTTLGVAGVIILVFTISIFWVYAAGLVEQREMATQTMDSANNVTEFPEVNEENPRIVPREVDSNQVKGSVSYRQHRLGVSDVARSPNGSMTWSYAIEPDDTRNKLIEEQRGVALSDMTRMDDRELRLEDDSNFPVGEGMYLHRSSRWNLVKTDYWSQYNDDSVRFVHNDDAYMSYPKSGHEWDVGSLGGIPVPYTKPVSNGVGVIDTDGNIDHYTLTEAQNTERLDGQRLYPLDVTTAYMQSLGYREGIINQIGMIGSHEGQVEMADMPEGAGNKQPFIIDLEDERFSYVIAFEPYGDDTRGLDEVWFVNAETGEYTYYATGEDNSLLGPERAMGIVRSEDSQTGWGDNFEVVEPVPTVVNGELWWHSKVVPTDNLDVTRNVFVNAHSGEAVELHTTDAIQEFIAGEDLENINETVDEVEKEPADDDPDVAYILVIKNADGEVIDRIEVEPGQEISIVPADNSTTNETGA